MSVIHMQTDEVRELARRACLEAEYFLQQTHELESRVRAMIWESGGSEEFRAGFEVRLRSLERSCEALDQLGILLNREVDQWEEADQLGAHRIGITTIHHPIRINP